MIRGLSFVLILMICHAEVLAQEIQYIDARPGENVQYFDNEAGIWNSDVNIFTNATSDLIDGGYSVISSDFTSGGDFLAGGIAEFLPPLRFVFDGLDPKVEYDFFFFSTVEDVAFFNPNTNEEMPGANGGVFFGSVLNDISVDVTAPTFGQPNLLTFDARDTSRPDVDIVDANGDITTSDLSPRRRNYVGTFTGSTEFGLYFMPNFGDALSTLDGVGISPAVPGAPSTLLGDVNRDSDVNFSDIAPFISVLQAGEFQIEADIDLNGAVNFGDIAGFIAILQNQ